MKFTVISDTHKQHRQLQLEGGDVLLHCGDFSGKGSEQQVREFNDWLGEQDYKEKVIIAGNHDFLFEREPEKARSLITNATYLEDSFVEIDSIKIYGSPWQPWFYDWAFNLQRGRELAEKWALIPDDTDILLTHGPPFGIGDRTNRGQNVGCEDLLARLKQLSVKFHCFGHIHEDPGTWTLETTTLINASICNEKYQPANTIKQFEL